MDDSRFKRRPTHNRVTSFVYRRSSGFARARDITRGVEEICISMYTCVCVCVCIYVLDNKDGYMAVIICVYRMCYWNMCNAKKEVLIENVCNCLKKMKREIVFNGSNFNFQIKARNWQSEFYL